RANDAYVRPRRPHTDSAKTSSSRQDGSDARHKTRNRSRAHRIIEARATVLHNADGVSFLVWPRYGRNERTSLAITLICRREIDLAESVDASGLRQLIGADAASRSPRFIRLKASVCSRKKGGHGLDAKVRELTIIALVSCFSLGLAWAYEADFFCDVLCGSSSHSAYGTQAIRSTTTIAAVVAVARHALSL